MTSLDTYVSRMKQGQKDIFYMAADSVEVGSLSSVVCSLVECSASPEEGLL
jgi:HSP90 family molecular chaperone